MFFVFPANILVQTVDMTPASHHLDKRTSGCRYLADSRVLSWLLEVYTHIYIYIWRHDSIYVLVCVYYLDIVHTILIFLRFLTNIMLIYNNEYIYIHKNTLMLIFLAFHLCGQAVAETGKRIRDLRGPKGGEIFGGDLHEIYIKGSTGKHGVNESVLRLFKGS